VTTPTAIPTALARLRTAIPAALDSLVSSRVFERQAPPNVALPCIVWHSQDNGGQRAPRVGIVAWEGLITVRAFAVSQDAADALAQTIATTLPGRTLVSGDRVAIDLDRPLTIPSSGITTTYTAAVIFRAAVQGG
jgi:hypothetical protein